MNLAQLWSVESGWGWLSSGGEAGTVELIFAAVLGLCLGSFLNVVIHRLPRDESVLWPRSHCPGCGHQLAVWENMPLVSFLILGGKCYSCKVRIPWRYPMVELISGIIMTGVVAALGIGPAAVGAALFILALLAIAWIDAEHRIIPDEVSIGLIVVGLVVRGFTVEGVMTALLGAGLGFLALALVAVAYRQVRGGTGWVAETSSWPLPWAPSSARRVSFSPLFWRPWPAPSPG